MSNQDVEMAMGRSGPAGYTAATYELVDAMHAQTERA